MLPMHDASVKNRILKGHSGAVKSMAFDPLREYLASVGADGTVRIWKYSDKDQEVASLDIAPPTDPKYVSIIPNSQESEKSMSRLEWHPNGEFLAVPTKDGKSGTISIHDFEVLPLWNDLNLEMNGKL